jgi:DNA polymerase III delta prime subunit
MLKTLYLFRGLPGSGKSTAVQALIDRLYNENKIYCVICSADFFWYNDGKYDFRAELREYAHQWCQGEAYYSMFRNKPVVIVDNCNMTVEEMFPYFKAAGALGYKVVLMESDTAWRYNVEECAKRTLHKVSLEQIQRMANKWQPLKIST